MKLHLLESQLQELTTKTFEVEPVKRYFTNDATIEAIGILAKENPRGILVLLDELMSLLMSFEKPGREADRQAYLTGWNGDSAMHTDRITRGCIYVENFCLSVLGGIQPDVFQAYMAGAAAGGSNDGLVQRLQVMVLPDPTPQRGVVDKSPDLKAADALRQVFDRLDAGHYLRYAKSDIEGAPPYFGFDDAAQPLFFDWHLRNDQRVSDLGSGMLAQHLNKYPKLVAGLALIFHLVEAASGNIKDHSAIGAKSLQMAIGFSEYLEAHARRVYSLAAAAKFRSAHALAEKIVSQQLTGYITVRGLQRKGWSGLTEKDELEAAFAELAAANWIRKLPSDAPKGAIGRPAGTRYEINPKIFEANDSGVVTTKPTKVTSRRKRK
jgi:hypothetical protein